ncbi:MAG: nitrogen fixation protein NifM [Enterobacteriaceae bacterium]|nr:nitrogen fixation protein NifM [Enterobacteriaceae bacterium]
MSKAWEQFARWRLAKTRWNCEPQNIPASEKAAFEQAWRRQYFLERAIIQQAHDLPLTDALLQRIDASLAELLTESAFTGEERQAVVRHHALMELQFVRINGQTPLPDDLTVLTWYQRNQEKFMRPEQRLTHHLLLTVDNDNDVVRRQAMQFYREIQTSREAFSRLAKRYSHCPSALEGGLLGWISRGLLYPELESALFALPENGIAAPVETELGWHIVWCEHIRGPQALPQTEALEKAREFLWRQSQQQWQQTWLNRLLAEMPA